MYLILFGWVYIPFLMKIILYFWQTLEDLYVYDRSIILYKSQKWSSSEIAVLLSGTVVQRMLYRFLFFIQTAPIYSEHIIRSDIIPIIQYPVMTLPGPYRYTERCAFWSLKYSWYSAGVDYRSSGYNMYLIIHFIIYNN